MVNEYNVVIKRQGKGGNWGIYLDGRLVEGGFFSQAKAKTAADWIVADCMARDLERHENPRRN